MFVIKELLKRNHPVSPICTGLKILSLTYNNYIRFIDSANFMPMPLSKMPKAFDLGPVAKGTYPLLFNTPQNYNYVGEIPSLTFYIFDEEKRPQMEEWYESKKADRAYVFDNRKELIRYCEMDVTILRKACARYMSIFLTLADFNPFTSSITLAQCVLSIFRKEFMTKDSLGICPSNNYSSRCNQSLIGQKWLLWCDQQLKRRLKREYRLPCNLIVDGYDSVTNTCYEFLASVLISLLFYKHFQ